TDSEREKVIALLKNFTLQMTGYRGWDEAIVTAGGIALSEVNSKTMESKLIDGLYFAGEILDLSGNTGGYNLQIAFSTGWLAAESAVKKLSVSGEGNHSTPGFRTED
ncbi:MAG: NAD(P)/FAD-dependent oxidoreductase, partial [Bacteroidales bacterium]